MALALGNRRKAATMLVALGPERAAVLMRSLDEDAMRELAAEVALLGPLPADEVNAVLNEVAEEIIGRRIAAEGGARYARDLLSRVLGADRADEVMASIAAGEPRPFVYLEDADPAVAARALAPEPVASVALALAHLAPESAARILVCLPELVSTAVAVRLAGLEHAHPDVIADVDRDFAHRLRPVLEERVRPIAGLSVLVELLNRASRETERQVLDAIESHDPELAGRVRDALFVFDDVVRLDDRAIQQVLKTVDTRDLAAALKGAADATADAIMRNLSERARANLQEEIEFLKGVRPADITDARTRIVRVIRTLEDEGAIVIERAGEDTASG